MLAGAQLKTTGMGHINLWVIPSEHTVFLSEIQKTNEKGTSGSLKKVWKNH